MRRRTFVAGSIGTLGALAGCSSLTGGGGSGPRTPVESFVQAYAANDSDTAQAAVHPESPLADDLQGSVADRQLELDDATVVSEENGTAVVEANVSVRTNGTQWQEPRQFEVREHEGDWRVWSMATGPEVALERYFEDLEAGRTDAALDWLHAESPDRQWLNASIVESAAPTLQSTTLTAFRTDEATVDVTFTETVGEQTSERTRQAELRRRSDGWRVWSLRFGPVVPVYEYVRVLDGNDPDKFEEILHPGSPVSDTSLGMLNLEELSASMESVRVVAGPEDGVATVETAITIEYRGDTSTANSTIEVRSHEGDWLLYQ